MKQCNKCGEYKQLDMFYKNSHCKEGFEPQCKLCIKKRRESNYKPKIYKITNIKNKKIYIGQTKKPLTERLSHHFSRAKSGESNNLLYMDIYLQDYNKDDFIIEEIEDSSGKDINDLEKYYIAKYRLKYGSENIYNLDGGGSYKKDVTSPTRLRQSRSKGTKSEIYVYNWRKKSFIGSFMTVNDFYKNVNKTNYYTIKGLKENNYGFVKDFLIIYAFVENHNIILENINKYKKNNKRNSMVGEKNNAANNDSKTVESIIIDLIKGVKYNDISIKYNVKKSLISSINNRKSWSHIKIEGYENTKRYQETGRGKV